MLNKEDEAKKYILQIEQEGLIGRKIMLPAKSKTKQKNNILFIYGHHSSLERWWGLVKVFSSYGNVTVPDLPGFGGMDSFYKIGKKPTIDNLADYLAKFITNNFENKQVLIAGMSFGFVIVTRMLQRHPELTGKVKLLVSVVGFADKKDFTFSKTRYYLYLVTAKLFTHRPFSTIFRYGLLNSFILSLVYSRTHNAKHKFSNVNTKAEFDNLMNVEIGLWQNNDLRTYMFTTTEFLKLNQGSKRVNLKVWHVAAKADHFFDNKLVEEHMRLTYDDFESFMTNMTTHAPSVISDEETAAKYIPEKLHLLLNEI